MAGDLIRDVRRAVLTQMKADDALKALVPADRMYPSTTPATPTFPFTRLDGFNSLPLDGACYAGGTITLLAHGFAKDRKRGSVVEDYAEDVAGKIGSAMKLALHRKRVTIGDATARLNVRSVRLIRDGDDDDAYHTILSVEARVIIN